MARDLDLGGQKSEASSGGFAPLAAGDYNVTIFDVEDATYGPKSANAGRPSLRVQLRVSEGQEGTNRRLFETIPLFARWAPTAKNPDGSDAFTFFDFFAAVRGESPKDFRKSFNDLVDAGENPASLLPANSELLGKPLTVVLKVENDTYAFNKAVENGDTDAAQEDFKRNSVKTWKKAAAGGGGAKPLPKADAKITL